MMLLMGRLSKEQQWTGERGPDAAVKICVSAKVRGALIWPASTRSDTPKLNDSASFGADADADGDVEAGKGAGVGVGVGPRERAGKFCKNNALVLSA